MPHPSSEPDRVDSPTPEQGPGPLERVISGFGRPSIQLMPILLVVYVVVGLASRSQGIPPLGTDLPVLVLWSGLTLLILWGVQPRRDLALTLGAMAGGLTLEWWGTSTELWHYFSDQRPPPWILAAWPAVGLASDRLAVLLGALFPRSLTLGRLHWPFMLGGLGALAHLALPSLLDPTTLVVFAIAGTLVFAPGDRDQDASVFLAGTLIGVVIEWWGTTRGVWTYHNGLTPPWEAIVAHGVAAVAFVRAGAWLGWAGRRLSPGPPARSDRAPG